MPYKNILQCSCRIGVKGTRGQISCEVNYEMGHAVVMVSYRLDKGPDVQTYSALH